MTPLTITIPITPVGQMRARSRAVKINGQFRAMTHKAPGQRLREESLMALLARHKPADKLVGPLALGVRCYMPIPKTMSKTMRRVADTETLLDTRKPDLDNLLKHLKDCLTQLEFWEDDKQVAHYLPSSKLYSPRPRWEITILEIGSTLGHPLLLAA